MSHQAQRTLFDPNAEALTDPKWMWDRDRILKATTKRQNAERLKRAREFVLKHLRESGPASGEVLTKACKEAGITLTSDKAFGAVFSKLSGEGQIAVAGTCPRTKGHGSPGFIWKLAGQ